MGRYFEVVLMSGALLMPLSAGGAHFLGHGQAFEPSQQQVNEFCNKTYPEISQSPQYSPQQKNEAEKLYKQYCLKQPAPAPAQPIAPAKPEQPRKPEATQGRIDRIEGPSCARPGAEIRVRGRELRRGGLSCRLQSNGQRRPLNGYSRTDSEYRFRLGELPAATDYGVECEVSGDRDRIRLEACPSPAEQADGTDLAPRIIAGALRPGETQTVEVSVTNRGRSQPGNRRHRLVLVLADRDVSRVGMRSMSSALAPAADRVLAEKRQWIMRIPGPGRDERVPVAINVPAQLPDGVALHWCAYVDADQHVAESDERNNLDCVRANGESGAVARDDLSGMFGSAVRTRRNDIGAQVPEPIFDVDDMDGLPENRVLMEGDADIPPMVGRETVDLLPVDALLDFRADALIDPSALLRLGDAYFTDLSIIAMQRVQSGPDRGKLVIVVKAQPLGGDRPAQASFPVVLRDESGELWSGTGRVKPLLLGWGDWIVTDYMPRGPSYVTAEINRSPYTYDEGGNTGNNMMAKAFNWDHSTIVRRIDPLTVEERASDDSPTTVREVTRADQGPDWSRLRVAYAIAPDRHCRVRLVPSPSGPPSSGREDRVSCTIGGFQSGRDTEAEFLCRVRNTVFGVEPFQAQETAYMECRDGGSGGGLKTAGIREWRPRTAIDEPAGPASEDLADYFIPFAEIRYRDGKPARLTVNVSVILSPGTLMNGWLTPNITVEAVNGGRTVISKTYRVPRVGTATRPELGTHVIDLRESHGWSWREEESGDGAGSSWIQITIDGVVQRTGEIAGGNNTYRIDLDRVHPVAVLRGTL